MVEKLKGLTLVLRKKIIINGKLIEPDKKTTINVAGDLVYDYAMQNIVAIGKDQLKPYSDQHAKDQEKLAKANADLKNKSRGLKKGEKDIVKKTEWTGDEDNVNTGKGKGAEAPHDKKVGSGKTGRKGSGKGKGKNKKVK